VINQIHQQMRIMGLQTVRAQNEYQIGRK